VQEKTPRQRSTTHIVDKTLLLRCEIRIETVKSLAYIVVESDFFAHQCHLVWETIFLIKGGRDISFPLSFQLGFKHSTAVSSFCVEAPY
jgi:hypothetical protein